MAEPAADAAVTDMTAIMDGTGRQEGGNILPVGLPVVLPPMLAAMSPDALSAADAGDEETASLVLPMLADQPQVATTPLPSILPLPLPVPAQAPVPVSEELSSDSAMQAPPRELRLPLAARLAGAELPAAPAAAAPPVQGDTQVQPQPAPQAKAALEVEIDLQQPLAQPVVAEKPVQPQVQLQVLPPMLAQAVRQAQPAAPRRVEGEAELAAIAPADGATTDGEDAVTAPAPRGASAAAPTQAAPVTVLAQAVTPAAIDIAAPAAPAPQAAAAPAISQDVTQRHDFEAVVDRLAEARELARPGRADMRLAHAEFGHVSLQFEIAGKSLKVAMASPDAAFAPAVQAALADRPIAAVADAARTDANPQRQDGSSAQSFTGSQAAPDGQRQSDQQARAAQGRSASNGVARQQDEEAADTAARQSRDGGRFA